MQISLDLIKNKSYLEEKIPSSDIEYITVKINKCDGLIVYCKDVCDKDGISKFIITPLENYKNKISFDKLWGVFTVANKNRVENLDDALTEIISGNVVLFANGLNKAFSFELKKFEKRAISEPPTSAVLKGPREGFVENLSVNISMMRRRLKTPDLIFKSLTIGKYSKTQVCVCYISSIADNKVVKRVIKKLNEINIDAIIDSSYVSKFLSEHKTSIFKQIGNTEKPDVLTAKILEGRVAVIVDGSPIALTVPYMIIEDFQSPSDYYSSSYAGTFARILCLLSVIISLLLPSFYLAAELFHLQLIPLSFLLTIVNSIKGIPLSPSYEMFFTLLIFEILNEASVRMPKYVGMVVSIVGALVLGETAVSAGIISAPTLMIIAFSGICLYTVPELEQSFSLLRLLLLFVAGSFGGYGLIVSVCGIIIYLVSFENFGTPILAPFAPIIKNDLKDSFYKDFLLNSKYRPLALRPKNKKRLNYIDKGE